MYEIDHVSLHYGTVHVHYQGALDTSMLPRRPATSVKLASELGEITFSTGKPKLTPGEAPTFQGF